MGLNEFAGYFAVAGSALATGYVASRSGCVRSRSTSASASSLLGLLLSALLVRETRHHVAARGEAARRAAAQRRPTQREVFARTTLLDRTSRASARQASSTTSTTAWRGACSRCSSPRPDWVSRQIGVARRDLSGRLGHGAALHRRSARTGRPQVAHRRGHVDAGGGIALIALSRRLRRVRSRRGRCSASGPRWSTRRCSPRSATWLTRPGERRRRACTGCGGLGYAIGALVAGSRRRPPRNRRAAIWARRSR